MLQSANRSISSAKLAGMDAASTGVAMIDAALGGLITGDNVVWVADEPELYRSLVQAFVAANRSADDRILYVDLGGGALDAGRGVERIDARAGSPFGKAGALADEIERRVLASRPGCLVVDGLGHVRRRWREGTAAKFFGRLCPAMLQAGVTAYWSIDSALGRAFAEDVRQITQCMLDVRGGRLRVLKAEGRPNAMEGMIHRLQVDDGRITVTLGPAGGRLARGLIAVRDQLGLTQQDVATMAGVTASAISQAEAGARGLSLDTVVAIADRLDLPVDRLLGNPSPRPYRLARHDRSRRIADGNVVALASDSTVGLRAYLLQLGPLQAGTPPFEHRGAMLFAPIFGVMQVDLDDDRPVLRTGDVLIVETGSVHAWRNLRRDPMTCSWILRD
jgi:transcriptional regulator with XRE-family HTH domain